MRYSLALATLLLLTLHQAAAQSITSSDAIMLAQSLGVQLKTSYPGRLRIGTEVYTDVVVDESGSQVTRPTSPSSFPLSHDSTLKIVMQHAGAIIGPLLCTDFDCQGVRKGEQCAMVALDTYVLLSQPAVTKDTAVFEASITRRASQARLPAVTKIGNLTFVRQDNQWRYVGWKKTADVE